MSDTVTVSLQNAGTQPDNPEDALIEAVGVSSGYGQLAVLQEIDLAVRPGQIVALLGANGAGKTTTVLTLAGELKPMKGEVRFLGKRNEAPLFRRARQGLAYVGEDRSVFMTMTVAENLQVARGDAAYAYDLFPELRELRNRRTGLLSGGEQQMLALARVLGRHPKVLLADELSLGLAPLVVDRLLDAVRLAADRDGLGVLLVEQHVEKALGCADYVYVLRRGAIALEGTAHDMRGRIHELHDTYLSSH